MQMCMGRRPRWWCACMRPACAQPGAALAATGGMGDEDLDVAVFRFTLGIPGFEDRMIPRVVSYVGGGLLAVNHITNVVLETQV
jgi:hypothetical protein